MKIGLALGGGGARGFANLGVLEVLEEEGISVDIVSGTSMGALVGGLSSQYKDVSVVKDRIFKALEKSVVKNLESQFAAVEKNQTGRDAEVQNPLLFLKEVFLWNVRLFRKHLVEYAPFEELFKFLFGDAQFADCKIPFLCVATDLAAQESVYLREGFLWKAVFSSIALPGIFPAIEYDEKILVDGGVLESVPTNSLKTSSDFIIAVSLEKKITTWDFRNSMDIASSVDEIRHKKLVEMSLSKADFVLEPAVSDFGWADFSRIDELIEEGRQEAVNKMPLLKKKIKQKRIFSFLSSPFVRKKEVKSRI